jgi:YidC/Oxa1 family membrane protein insertase
VEQRRLLLAFAISVVVIVVYQYAVSRLYKSPPSTAQRRAQTTEPTAVPPPPKATPVLGEIAAPPAKPLIKVKTDTLRVAITPVGGRIADLRLKNYAATVAAGSEPLALVRWGSVLPGTLDFGPKRSDAAFQYRPDRREVSLHGNADGEITLVADAPDGVQVEKRYRFKGSGYVFDVTASVAGDRRPSTVGLVMTPLRPEAGARGEMAIAFAAARRVQNKIPDLLKAPIRVDNPTWAGFESQYFLAVALPASTGSPVVFTTAADSPIARVEAPITDDRVSFSLFTGPKDREILTAAGRDLDHALDFGRFFFISIPLLEALRYLYRVLGNYGLAIIVLTAFVKLITAPLTRTTFRNMREMQKIQPQMAKLREKFKDDQVALQKEMMELYRRHHVNPFSGCLPMLLQMPIFFGLYSALSQAIDLRHAAFMLWIRDLSAPDRLLIPGIPGTAPLIGGGVPVLTLLMGGSMLLQQWLSPQQGDPTQQRMMMFMPLLFTFMFINFPAGLALYWLVNNVLTIGQQYLMMRSAK